MKTLQQAIELGTSPEQSSVDSRLLTRLCGYMTVEQIEQLGYSFNDPSQREAHQPIEFTEQAVIAQLKQDVEFGFEKALNQRGISASLMFNVVKGWIIILDLESEFDFDNYAQYGLPLFKAVAVRFGFDNPIGEDAGNESKYASE